MVSTKWAAIVVIVLSAFVGGIVTWLTRPLLPYLWPSYWVGWGVVLLVAAALGLLEAAWTGPGRGGPFDAWKGVLAIYGILLLLTFPLVWLVPLLAIVEEITHGFTGYEGWRPTWNTVFRHWSRTYLGFNIYPYLSFPIMTVGVELLYRLVVL